MPSDGGRWSQRRYLNSASEEESVCDGQTESERAAMCVCVQACDPLWLIPRCLSVSCPFAFWLLESPRGEGLTSIIQRVCVWGFLKVGDNGYWSSWQVFLHTAAHQAPYFFPLFSPLCDSNTSCTTPLSDPLPPSHDKWFNGVFCL